MNHKLVRRESQSRQDSWAVVFDAVLRDQARNRRLSLEICNIVKMIKMLDTIFAVYVGVRIPERRNSR
jgi:hypothetical protein